MINHAAKEAGTFIIVFTWDLVIDIISQQTFIVVACVVGNLFVKYLQLGVS